MIPIHHDHSFEIKRLKFISDQNIRFPNTALVHFHMEDRDKPVVELMGHMDEKEIYAAIDRGEAINLDQCYVEKFSLRDYRLIRNMDEREIINIKGFTARNALFSGLSSLDFSHAVIEGEEFSLEGSWIERGNLNFEGTHFQTSLVSFHNSRLPDAYVNFKNVDFGTADISFKNCRFGKGDKDFQYMNMSGGELQFINADFSQGNVNFINTNFGSGNVSFKVARFGNGKVDFHFSTFKGNVLSFERTEFGDGRVDFRTVEFGPGRVNFNRAVFGAGEVNFDEADKDGGKFSIKRCSFGPGDLHFEELSFDDVDVSFERCSFGYGKMSFYKSWLGTLSMEFCHLNDYVDLRVRKCRNINLSNTVVRDIIDINPYEFNSEIDSLEMPGMRLIGRIYLDWVRSGVKRMIYAGKYDSYRLRAEQFLVLKENFQNQGAYNDEDRAYVEFKRNESKDRLHAALEKSPLNAIHQYPLYWFKLVLFDWSGLYATSPVRVFFTMLGSFVLFSFAYYFLMVYTAADIIASVDDQLGQVARSFYHSAITFLTIGYGDHYPFGAIRWVSAVEGFFGLFLMSYFTVAFVRKVLR